jgi:hypothetical protein
MQSLQHFSLEVAYESISTIRRPRVRPVYPMTDDEHPEHELRIDRGPAHLRIISGKFLMHLRQIKDRSNLANKVIVRNSLIKTE